MVDQAKNIMIGFFVIAACGIVVFAILFLHPTVGNERLTLRVRFANIDKVTIGSRVTFAGKPVGEVVEIREIPEAIDHRKSKDGFVYVYELKLKVDSSVNVYNTDEVTLHTSGLLGERSVSIDPKPPKPGEALRLVNDNIIYATETGTVEETFKDLKVLGLKLDTALDSVVEAFDIMKKHKLWDSIGNTAHNLDDITTALNQPEYISKTIENAYDVSKKAVKSWDVLDLSLHNIADTTTNTSVIAKDTREIMNRVKNGESTAGKLLVKDDLYLKTDAILSKAEITMNDINHYGLLFHTDKGWQRVRARRLNLLYRLSSPQEFRNYFNDEVDQISTSLSRVSMILDKTKCIPPCCSYLLDNCEFTKVYAELLRRVADIEEGLRMYNQQLNDCKIKRTTELAEE